LTGVGDALMLNMMAASSRLMITEAERATVPRESGSRYWRLI
jgi:hypothetical protein